MRIGFFKCACVCVCEFKHKTGIYKKSESKLTKKVLLNDDFKSKWFKLKDDDEEQIKWNICY